jgi:hypothetical protein
MLEEGYTMLKIHQWRIVEHVATGFGIKTTSEKLVQNATKCTRGGLFLKFFSCLDSTGI